MSQQFVASDAKKVSVLANIPITDQEAEVLAKGFTTTMKVVDELNSIPVTGIIPTHHVTGLENVLREDIVDEKRMFTQEQALQNAPRKYNGFFVVDQIIDQE